MVLAGDRGRKRGIDRRSERFRRWRRRRSSGPSL